jgi:hypothetical protein
METIRRLANRLGQNVGPLQIARTDSLPFSPRQRHTGAVRNNAELLRATPFMPTLFRFLTVTAILVSIVYGGLYAVATFFEPVQREVSRPLPGVKVK